MNVATPCKSMFRWLICFYSALQLQLMNPPSHLQTISTTTPHRQARSVDGVGANSCGSAGDCASPRGLASRHERAAPRGPGGKRQPVHHTPSPAAPPGTATHKHNIAWPRVKRALAQPHPSPSSDPSLSLRPLPHTTATITTPLYAPQKIASYNLNPEFNCYLVHIFACLTNEQVGDEAIRQLAGLLLKNNLRATLGRQPAFLPPAVLQHVHAHILAAVGDASAFIRRTAATVVTTLATFGEFEDFPSLLPTLLSMLDAADQHAVDGAWHAIEMITEDVPDKLDVDFDDPPKNRPEARPVHSIVLKALSFFPHANPAFRKCAVASIGNVMERMPQVLLTNMEQYLAGISSLAADPSPEVRKLVCGAIVTLMEMEMGVVLGPHLASVSEFMLLATQDADEEVALQAGEFWCAFCNQGDEALRPCLEAMLPRLVPVLLEKMTYSQEEIEEFDAQEEDDQAVPDRAEEIAPIFHRSKAAELGEGSGGGGAGDDAGEEEDDDDDDDAEVSQWTLRKCAANGLDNIASEFGDDILPLLLQRLQDKLQSTGHWAIRESAILALGAISDGCYEGIIEHMPVLYPYLLTLLQDSAPLIRSITCWTLGRYAHWVVESPPEGQSRLGPLVEALLQRILDKNKKVQEAACSAFAVVVEQAQHDILPFLVPILQNLMFAFRKYQTKNLLMMYDAVGTLCESVSGSEQIRDPGCVAILLPPLVEKWHQLDNTDRQIFPLLECFTSVAKALGPVFASYAPPAWARAVAITESVLLSQATTQAGEEAMDDEFAVCALDLLAGITESLGEAAIPLVGQPNFLRLVFECMKHPSDDVRQSAFALVGDLSTSTPEAVRSVYEQFCPILIGNIDPRCQAVCNNATWAVGEISLVMGAGMEQFAVAICSPLLEILCDPHGNPSLRDNAVTTVGRIGWVCPAVVAPLLATSNAADAFLSAISVVGDLREKVRSHARVCEQGHANALRCLCMFAPLSLRPLTCLVCPFAAPCARLWTLDRSTHTRVCASYCRATLLFAPPRSASANCARLSRGTRAAAAVATGLSTRHLRSCWPRTSQRLARTGRRCLRRSTRAAQHNLASSREK